MADSSKTPKRFHRAAPLDDAGSSQDAAPPKRPPVRRTAAEGGAEAFDFGNITRSHQEALQRETRRRGRPSPAVMVGAVALFCAVIGVSTAYWMGRKEPLALKPVDDQVVDELSTLEFTAAGGSTPRKTGPLKFTLHNAPEGARIDPKTGKFTWRPTELQGPGRYDVTVRVTSSAARTLPAQQRIGVLVREVQQPPVLAPIEEKKVDAGGTLAFEVRGEDPDVPSQPVRFRLVPGAPPGAAIDPISGQFRWTPRDVKPGEVHQITVQARKAAAGGLTAEETFRVRVEGPVDVATEDPNVPIDRFVGQLRDEGLEVLVSDGAFPHPPLAGKLRVLSIDGEKVGVFGYGTAEAAARDAQGLTPDDLQPYAKSPPERPSAYLFQHDGLIAFYVGHDAPMLNLLDEQLGRPAVVKTIDAAPPARETPHEPAEDSFPQTEGDEIILELYRKHKFLSKREYPTLRKVFTDRFERQHREEIRQAFGEKDDEMRQWLDKHVDLKQEFYLAIDPKHDNVPKVLALFKELKQRFPEKIESYANLAIAVAVVWDDERRGAYDYVGLQKHSNSRLPDGRLGAIENFKYVLDAEDFLQGRGQLLPWEFLRHVVNHRTPLVERQWALVNYVPKRVMYGKCYHDVPYDFGMLERGAEAAKLNGQDYTLPNLRQFGGVCAYQADFAGRVGKSIGVPAEFVSGPSRYGENHAWVMWVELGSVTATGFTFSLESHGRYRGDRYYVGTLGNPQTGEKITDRQLELRLHTVAMDPIARRQADLVMRCYPMLRDRTEMNVPEQLSFLSRVIDFSPGNEEAWIALAQMSREGQITKVNSKPMIRVLDRLFTTFATLPDFTWIVFDDLVSFQDVPNKRAALFGRLAALYERAKRPDLSCKARLKFVEYLLADERLDEAIRELTLAILMFPEEGNFVPKMLDKLEELCGKHKQGQQHLVRFYQDFLPKIPRYRDKRPSSYCIEMYKRGIERFQAAGMQQLVQTCQAQLDTLEAARDGKP